MPDHVPWFVTVVSLGCLLLAVSAGIALSRAQRRWKTWARARRALAGERRAERLLKGAGFRIIERQPRRRARLMCDATPIAYEVRADLLTRKHDRLYVAEVKTGTLVSELRHGPTRRQLLEYSLVFDVDGVLLVDALRGHIHEVRFN